MSFPAGSDADGTSAPVIAFLAGRAGARSAAVCRSAAAVVLRVAAGACRAAPPPPERRRSAETAAAPLSPREFVRDAARHRPDRGDAVVRRHRAVPDRRRRASRWSSPASPPPGATSRAATCSWSSIEQNQDKLAFEKAAEYRDLVEQIAKKRAEHEAAPRQGRERARAGGEQGGAPRARGAEERDAARPSRPRRTTRISTRRGSASPRCAPASI